MKIIQIYVFSTCLLLCFKIDSQSLNAISTLDKKIEAAFQKSELPGFTVSIVNAEKIIFQKACGFTDINTKTEMTTKHVQSIASVSKTFLGVALLKAEEMGLLNMDTDINDYLPFNVQNPRFPNQIITLRHLATHTSGIQDQISDYQKIFFLENPLDSGTKLSFIEKRLVRKFLKNEERPFAEFLKDIFLPEGKFHKKKIYSKHSPGLQYKYSNVATALAGHILETQAGMPYEQFIENHIFKPLKIRNAGFDIRAVPAHLKTTNHLRGKALPENIHLLNPGGGLLISNQHLSYYLSDMISGCQGKGQILKTKSYQAMFAKQLDESNPIKQSNNEVNQGIFWTHRTDGQIGHTGGGLGNNSFLFFNPETGIGKIFMTNCDMSDNKKYLQTFLEVWNLMKEYEQTIKSNH